MYTHAKIVAAAGLVAVANSHMVIKSPQPFSFLLDTNAPSNSNGGASNRPLSDTGSDFPCRHTSGSWDGPVNSYALGSKQTLELVGSAVHGGGSCQLSITYDTAPTKDSVWKVIHTVQGGCPARNTAGNLPANDASAADPFTYDYTIPSDIPAGNATIAWSWINRIGNREFYMNCGALSLTGTGGDKSNYEKLPDLFVANIPSVSTCSSDVGGSNDLDITIPNPGDSVETNSAAGVSTTTYNPATCPAATATGGSGGSSGSTTKAGSSAAATSSAAAGGASSSAGAGSGGVFITKTTSAGSGAATTTAAAQPSSTAAAPSSVAAAPSSGTSTGVKSGACTTEGEYSCSGSSFQQCASGQWSVSMPLAAGTSCTPGVSSTLNMVAARGPAIRGRRL